MFKKKMMEEVNIGEMIRREIRKKKDLRKDLGKSLR